MPVAYLIIRPGLPYRSEAFAAGLGAAGYDVLSRSPPPGDVKPDTVLVTWNRTAHSARDADTVEQRGGTVLVAENGYLGKGDDGYPLYAMARNHHSGAGEWPDGDPGRWDSLGITLAPWRSGGDHILVLGQRGIGHPLVAMPRGWDRRVADELRKLTRRPIKFRPHPGNERSRLPGLRSLKDDLHGCHAVVTWNSAAGLRAIVAGVPVFCAFPKWIGASAARPLGHDIEDPFMGDRLPMLRRLANAQWSITEIRSGEPFRRLLAL